MENKRLVMDGNLMDGLNCWHPNIVTPDRKHIQIIMKKGTEMQKPMIRRPSSWEKLIYLSTVKETVLGGICL